jgi:hypothetical protein
MEVEGDIVAGIGSSLNDVFKGEVVHGIAKLSRQNVEERHTSCAGVWCGGC